VKEKDECGIDGEKNECVGELKMINVKSVLVNMCKK
jgi:hypothetical protein